MHELRLHAEITEARSESSERVQKPGAERNELVHLKMPRYLYTPSATQAISRSEVPGDTQL
jgi:hypothetical protein